MKVRRDEGVANRIGPEPYADIREDYGEASAGEHIGQPWSRESLNAWWTHLLDAVVKSRPDAIACLNHLLNLRAEARRPPEIGHVEPAPSRPASARRLAGNAELTALAGGGSLRGSWTNVRCRAASARPSVTVKKNRNAETVELIIGAPARFSVKCDWKRRRFSLVAVSGHRLSDSLLS